MSASLSCALSCDRAGCGRTFSAGEQRFDVTRSLAAATGWVHGVIRPTIRGAGTRSIDYCPDHRSDLGDLTPKSLPRHAVPT
jgi:hypothetical protein